MTQADNSPTIEEADTRPWEQLEAIAETRDAERLEAYVESLTAGEAARALAHMSEEEQNRVLETLSPDDAAHLIEALPMAQAVDLIEHLPVSVAAAIVHELDSDTQADLVGELDEEDARAILAALDPQEAREIRELADYDEDVAGGLMITEVSVVSAADTVASVVDQLRRQADEYDLEIQYVFVADGDGRLCGVLRIRDLLFSPGERLICDIMIPKPVAVGAQTDLLALNDIFDRKGFLALPVVNGEGALIGLVTRSSVRLALVDKVESDHRKSQGIVGGEELRTMPLLERSKRRLSWLSVNILLNIAAASVIALFEETLTAVIALAFFLPIISDMSGCSGNQAVAVSIRELTLGLVKPQDLLFVWLKEIGIGVLNGAVLGALIGVVAWIWKGNAALGLVVGSALALNTMVAVSIGGAIPLILKRFDQDPALASGPILTTITDICGFFLVLGIATLMLSRLTG